MRTIAYPVVTAALVLAPVLFASREAHAEGCVPGAQISCPCLNGSQGVQVCADRGDRYAPCQCAEKSSSPAATPETEKSSSPAPTSDSPKGSVHLATVSLPGSPPTPPLAPTDGPTGTGGSATASGQTPGTTPSGSRVQQAPAGAPRAPVGAPRATRSQSALNLGLGLTIVGGLAFSVGGGWLITKASSEAGEGCTNTDADQNQCIVAASIFGVGAAALGVGIPLLVINGMRPPSSTATAVPSWQPTEVFVGRSNVRVVWAF
jgi:hypothetical protein